ncbi:MAG: hypothetical protein ABJI43_15415 [Roseobacter sp.]
METEHSLWEKWCAGADGVLTFQNARSAFAHILRHVAPRRVWLPAYCCSDLTEAANFSAAPLQFYHSDAGLMPDTAALSEVLCPGDLVLGINHFGRPAEALRPLAAHRKDVTWVEDCAQSVSTAAAPWAPFRIYSPRKLLGVPDGGLLIDSGGRLPFPVQRPASSATLRHAGLMRQRDYGDLENARWYAAFQRAEAQMGVSDLAMSTQTARILRTTSIATLAAVRRQNYAHLHAALAPWALWPDPAPTWVPLGFPLRVQDAGAICAALAEHRIFAPRHWRDLGSDEPCIAEMALMRELVTLPCDQRYDLADMDRIIDVLRLLLP